MTVEVPRFRGNGVIEFAPHEYRAPGPGELLVRIGANAICGTDRNEYWGGSPIVPGHEAAGVVEATGSGVGVTTGTRGVIYLMDFCGDCRSCRVGATNQCFAKRADVGQSTDGGYGRYALVHETNFFPVGPDLPLATATMLLDVMGTSGHALGRAERIRDDIESLYIAGAGPIGLGLVAMAVIRYGTGFPIYVSDLSPWRAEFAASFGATVVDSSDGDGLRDLAPDVAFDSTGKAAARRSALAAVGKRGALICVGHGEGLELDVSRDLIAPERAVIGSEYFRFDELAGNLRLLEGNQGLIERVITHRFDVSKIGEAFELFWSGRTGKVVITQGLDG
jgi:threonine dehydrogenase-like Zn-dependent dehydrogenase